MDLASTLKDLIKEGETLTPLGGGITHGWNSERQPDYVSWRLQAIAAIQELRNISKPILKDLEEDKHGPFFYKESASRVLGALKAALAISQRQTKAPRIPSAISAPDKTESDPKKVFLVHGHDKALLHQTA